MLNPKEKVSICICAYNEENIILSGLKKMKLGLDEILGPGRFELLVVQNGSTDNTPKLLDSFQDEAIRAIHLPEKGHGLALRVGIEQAHYDHVALLGLDLPFLFSDLTEALKIWENHDLVFGSKAHPNSQVEVTWRRKIASWVFRRLNRWFFGIKIRDTQGTVFMKRQRVLPYLYLCDSNNAFFTAQIAIYGQALGLKMAEVPVVMAPENRFRKSKYNVLWDGMKMFKTMFREFLRLKKRVFQHVNRKGL
jgi:glycosyltransferase involved in cell wall biosynthesis